MAQKRRWEQLQRTVRDKDDEIQRLKNLLQQLTNTQLHAHADHRHQHQHQQHVPSVADACDSSCDTRVAAPTPHALSRSLADHLARAELDLFVRLMWSPPRDGDANAMAVAALPPVAANLGCLHRVVVANVDGSVLGVRHRNDERGRAMGADVGAKIWEYVHSADVLHLKCSVVHASKLADMFDGHLNVFSYRRRRLTEPPQCGVDDHTAPFVRMKGCVYPVKDSAGVISRVLLAEFIEL
ncbi:unnamed protein product [Agarophyton chilense]